MRVSARRPARAGFTLIELMVVILIIAVLVAMTAVVLGKVRDTARRTVAISEMAQLTNAVSTFKTQMKVSYLPSCSPGSTTNLPFRLRGTYFAAPSGVQVGATSPEAIYLKQLFPQLQMAGGNIVLNGVTDQDLDANQAMMFFLTGGSATNFQGFSTNRANPFQLSGGQTIGPFLDVKADKLDAGGRYLDPWGNPYAYLAFDPNLNSYPSGLAFQMTNAQGVTTSVSPFSQGGKFLNLKGVQIVSAGKDGLFGPGGAWTPASGSYAIGAPGGADDLSNFNSTILSASD